MEPPISTFDSRQKFFQKNLSRSKLTVQTEGVQRDEEYNASHVRKIRPRSQYGDGNGIKDLLGESNFSLSPVPKPSSQPSQTFMNSLAERKSSVDGL